MAYKTVDFESYTISVDTSERKFKLENRKGFFSAIGSLLTFKNPFRVIKNLMEHYYLRSYNMSNNFNEIAGAFGMPSLKADNPIVTGILRKIAKKSGCPYDKSLSEYELANKLVDFLSGHKQVSLAGAPTPPPTPSHHQAAAAKVIAEEENPANGAANSKQQPATPDLEFSQSTQAERSYKQPTHKGISKFTAINAEPIKEPTEFKDSQSPYYLKFHVDMTDTGKHQYKKINDFLVLLLNNRFTAFQRFEVPNTTAVLKEVAASVDFKLRSGSAGQSARDLIKAYGNGDKSCAHVGDWFILLNKDKKVEVYCSLYLRALHVAFYSWGGKKYNPDWSTWQNTESEIRKLAEASIKEHNTSVEKHKKDKRIKIVPIPCPYFKGDNGSIIAFATLCEFKNADFDYIWESRFKKNEVKNMLRFFSKINGFESKPEWSPIYWGEQLVKTFGNGLRLQCGPFICESNANEEPVQSNNRSIKFYYDYVEGPVYAFACQVGFMFDPSWDDETFMNKLTDYLREIN